MRAAEQVRGGVDVAAVVCAAAGRAEVPAARSASARASSSSGPELGAVAVGLLEVVAEDLLVLADALAGEPLEPVGELLVQRGAELLGGRPVGRLADEDVLEAKRDLVRRSPRRQDGSAPSAPARRARRAQPRGRRSAESSTTAPRWKSSPSTAPALERVAGACLEPVETCAEQRVQARGQLDRLELAVEHPAPVLLAQHALVEEHRHQLLREQRVAGGNPGEPRPHRRRRASDQARRPARPPRRRRAARGAPSPATRDGSRAAPAAPGSNTGAARLRSSPGGPRAGRAAQARPSGCRRRARPADARPPRPPGTARSPGQSDRRSPHPRRARAAVRPAPQPPARRRGARACRRAANAPRPASGRRGFPPARARSVRSPRR